LKKNSDKIDFINQSDKEELREAFRYVFKDETMLSIVFLNKTVSLIDISAGGIAFMNKGFKKYEADLIQLDLDIPNFIGDTQFSCRTRILNINQNDVCNCIFEDCTIEQYELIHRYVLEMQKKDLRLKKHDSAH